jgi:RNA polymerase sigma-70 factor (ECF subfamily)
MRHPIEKTHRIAAGVEDAALVLATRGGDPRAALRIVRRYTPLVRRCLRASFTGADLEDQIQEVFLRCFTHLPRLRAPAALRSFLVGITLRCAAMERRRCRLRSWETLTRSGDLPERGASQPSIELRQVAARTGALLERLAPAAFRVLELRFIEERELRDVAKGLGVSRATAQRHVVRASGRVRALVRSEPAIAEYVGARAARESEGPLRGVSP